MKTLNLETCKRLQEAGLLEEKAFYNYMCPDTGTCKSIEEIDEHYYGNTENLLPAPNLEEAIELLPPYTKLSKNDDGIWHCHAQVGVLVAGKTPISPVQQILNYLLDNNLIGTTTN